MGETVLLLQAGVPLGLMTVTSTPPWNQPQLSPAVLSRLPTLVPDNCALNEPALEQTSPRGSASPISVQPPCPSETSSLDGVLVAVAWMMPLVCPETRLTAPGLEGPNCVL